MGNFHRHLQGRKGWDKVTDGVYAGVWDTGRDQGRLHDFLSQEQGEVGMYQMDWGQGKVDIVCGCCGIEFRGAVAQFV